jgi:uncharacterized Zn-binding protein involved in type VI secretion
MGNPAARQTDLTTHGGTVTVGCPTVMIGGMPAARQTDMHTCPMVTPGTPPVPHVGGPIMLGSTGVRIGGLPAARVNDMAMCTGPPDAIAMGCFTVMIGEVGSAGGGGGAAASGGGAASAGASVGEDQAQGHWIRYRFVDSAGRPLARVAYQLEDPNGEISNGRLAENGLVSGGGWESAGTCTVQLFTVSRARWSADEAHAGERLTLTADTTGFADGTAARVIIYECDLNRPERAIAAIVGEVSGNKVEVQWSYASPGPEEPFGANTAAGYSRPLYRFDVQVDPVSARSGLLKLTETLEIDLSDDQGNAMGAQPYELLTPDGAIQTGELDDDGRATLEDVSVRTSRIRFPNLPHGNLRAGADPTAGQQSTPGRESP